MTNNGRKDEAIPRQKVQVQVGDGRLLMKGQTLKENVVVHCEKVVVIFKGTNKKKVGALLPCRWIAAQTIVNESFPDHEKVLGQVA